jgi:type IV secretory pathway ATPase VirB11/archaellum biosynthesis ATPase
MRSRSDALTVAPGTYTDTLLPGEQLFYRVKLNFGQRVGFAVDAPTPGESFDPGSNTAAVYVALDMFTPDRYPVIQVTDLKTLDHLGFSTRNLVLSSGRDASRRKSPHVVIPDVTQRHCAVNIRKFTVRATHLDDLVELATLTTKRRTSLRPSWAAGLNILVSGGTQAAKTTLLNCVAAAIPLRNAL